MQGLMSMGRFFARSLGPDQPLYGINANGIDGRETTASDSQAMALAYVNEILDAQPSGPLLLGGMCAGGLVAMEVARELLARGREVGPLILLDPPPVPQIYKPDTWLVDPRNPAVASHLYQRVRAQLLNHDPRDIPFPVNDQQRVHLATLAGVNVLVALSRHRPKAFPGEATVILSSERAAAFFHPQMAWAKLLPQTPIAHVLSCTHQEFYKSARYNLAHVLKFLLEGVPHRGSRTECAVGSIVASA
jgi:thioesterase domain-containing protein